MKFREFLAGRTILDNGFRDLSPKVSIVMPTFCRVAEGYLFKCIDSVLAQAYRDFEFIVIDDGSSDGTQQVVTDYARRDPRIVYVRHDVNSGLPAVRTNEGILLARSPLVAFIFDDNEWYPDALLEMVEEMQRSDADVVHACTELMQPNGSVVLGRWPLTLELMQHLNTIPNGAVLCRSDFFVRFGLYDPQLALRRICDWDLWRRALQLGARFQYLDACLGREYGPVSDVSIGMSVTMDYKVVHAYMVDAYQLEERAAALAPERIDNYDVFSCSPILRYVRSLDEWRDVEENVYSPYFRKHLEYAYEPPTLHNRLFEPGFSGAALNPDSPVFSDRRRVLLVCNLYTPEVADWKSALEEGSKWIADSCCEWQLSAYSAADLDAVVLFDCTANFILEQIKALRTAGVAILYVVCNGEAPVGTANNCCSEADLAIDPRFYDIFKVAMYFPVSGVRWPSTLKQGANALMSLADRVLFTGERDELPDRGWLPVGAFPNSKKGAQHGNHCPAGRRAIYVGDPKLLSSAERVLLESRVAGASSEAPLVVAVYPGHSENELLALKGLPHVRIVPTLDSPATLATRIPGCSLHLSASVASFLGSYSRVILKERIEENGGALEPLAPTSARFDDTVDLHAPPRAASSSLGLDAATATRELRLRWDRINALIVAALFRAQFARATASCGRLDPKKIAVLINSPLLAGSETYGMLAAFALRELGFEALVAYPAQHQYGKDGNPSDISRWLSAHGLPAPEQAPYGVASSCLHMPENVVRSLGAALSNWLAPQGFASVLCSGFIPEPIVAPTAGPIVFYALFQPWGYELSQMTFLRDGVAGVLADSEWATEKWRRWLPPPVSHVPTYLEPEQFALRNQNLPETPVRIAVGGTLQPRKRQREAILAVRSLIARGHDIELRIYGYDLAMMAEYTAALRALASSPGLKGKVYFRGLVDITELVEENHVVLMTSIDESMPQTLLIAMAAGLIPVACPSGGIPEVVIEGETGFLAKGFDVAEIEGALERALAARSQWSQIRATARDLLAREYSSVPVSRKLIETLFEGLQIALSPGRRAFSASAGVDTPTSILGHFGGKTTTASRDGLTGTIWLKERVKGILGPSRSARVATMLTKLRRMARTSRPD